MKTLLLLIFLITSTVFGQDTTRYSPPTPPKNYYGEYEVNQDRSEPLFPKDKEDRSEPPRDSEKLYPSPPPFPKDKEDRSEPPPIKPIIDDTCYEYCKITNNSSIITDLDMERLRAGDPILLSNGEVVDLSTSEGFTLPNRDIVKLNMTTGDIVRVDTDGAPMTDVEKGHIGSNDTSKSDSEKLCYDDCLESPGVRSFGFFGNKTSSATAVSASTTLMPLTIIMLALK